MGEHTRPLLEYHQSDAGKELVHMSLMTQVIIQCQNCVVFLWHSTPDCTTYYTSLFCMLNSTLHLEIKPLQTDRTTATYYRKYIFEMNSPWGLFAMAKLSRPHSMANCVLYNAKQHFAVRNYEPFIDCQGQQLLRPITRNIYLK